MISRTLEEGFVTVYARGTGAIPEALQASLIPLRRRGEYLLAQNGDHKFEMARARVLAAQVWRAHHFPADVYVSAHSILPRGACEQVFYFPNVGGSETSGPRQALRK